MKSKTNQKLTIVLSLALVLASAFFWSTGRAMSAEPMDMKGMDAKMMAQCQEMKDAKQKMAADMKAQDADLTEQAVKMNSASDDKKVGLMAALVTHMVEQRTARDVRHAKMEEEMMQHMMHHMQMGKESTMGCPMMNGMKGMDEKPADAQPKHEMK